jgi:hypothetical protein
LKQNFDPIEENEDVAFPALAFNTTRFFRGQPFIIIFMGLGLDSTNSRTSLGPSFHRPPFIPPSRI